MKGEIRQALSSRISERHAAILKNMGNQLFRAGHLGNAFRNAT
jgi:hypothetical protein